MSIPKTQYFEAQPTVSSRPRTVRLRLGELDLELAADRGVFGFRGLDAGTMILLREAPPPPPSGELLDLGSGYGPIAIVVARRPPGARPRGLPSAATSRRRATGSSRSRLRPLPLKINRLG